MKKIIMIIIYLMTMFSYADSFNCDSNCMSGTDMLLNDNSTTGTQQTTSTGFYYFTGTSCNGYNLVENYSNGSQTIKEANSSTCGYVAPTVYDVSDSSTGSTDVVITCTNSNPCPGAYVGQYYGDGYTYVQTNSVQTVVANSAVSSYTGQDYTPTENSAIVMDNYANQANGNTIQTIVSTN